MKFCGPIPNLKNEKLRSWNIEIHLTSAPGDSYVYSGFRTHQSTCNFPEQVSSFLSPCFCSCYPFPYGILFLLFSCTFLSKLSSILDTFFNTMNRINCSPFVLPESFILPSPSGSLMSQSMLCLPPPAVWEPSHIRTIHVSLTALHPAQLSFIQSCPFGFAEEEREYSSGTSLWLTKRMLRSIKLLSSQCRFKKYPVE